MAFYNSAYASLLGKRPYSSFINQDFSSHSLHSPNLIPQFHPHHQKIPTVNQKIHPFNPPVQTEASLAADFQRKKIKLEQELPNQFPNRDQFSRIVNPISQFNGSHPPELASQFNIPKDRALEHFSRGNPHSDFQSNHDSSRHIFREGCFNEGNSINNLHLQSQMKQLLAHQQKAQTQNVNQSGILRFSGVSPQSLGFFNSFENLTKAGSQGETTNSRQKIEFQAGTLGEKNLFLTQRSQMHQEQFINHSSKNNGKSEFKQDLSGNGQIRHPLEFSHEKSRVLLNEYKEAKGQEREKKIKDSLSHAKKEERMLNRKKNSTPDSVEEDKSTIISPASFQIQDSSKFDLFNDEFGPEMDVFKHLEEFPFLDHKEGLFDLSFTNHHPQCGTMDSKQFRKPLPDGLFKQHSSKTSPSNQNQAAPKKRGRPRKDASQIESLPVTEKKSKELIQDKNYSRLISEQTRISSGSQNGHKQKPVLTKVGPTYQAWIPTCGDKKSGSGSTRRQIKKVWSPEDASQDLIESFVSKIQEAIGTKVDNFVSVLRVLKVYNMNSEHALEIIKRDPKYYQIYFKMSKKNSKLRFGH